ncbi:Sec1-like protein [Decorospora gaudefroyi]|uniref:Sec1-like protein n=1 Tax=Decorospora gaudefroyi TaxID=184978 RepID=A0A6A5K9X3_9PLEO|nr:Sec1-like protein [Decorospora gaudefroyi]
MALSLRDKQIATIKRILNLNAPLPDPDAQDAVTEPTSTADGAIWKVLILDDDARDVISSVLQVNDLRAAGVTVHFNIRTARHPIPDTPSIYLVAPTAENTELITKDLAQGLYSPAFLNFTSQIPRQLLEDFASSCASSGASEHLAQLYDQYLNFVVSDADQFHLNLRGAYHKINSSQTQDQELDDLINRIVSGLFSVVVTNGVVPIIRCPKGGAAEDIGAKLDRKLRDYILNNNNKETLLSDKSTSRPVLIIVDRNQDLTPMMSHSWIYDSLVYDVLDVRLNRINITVPLDKDKPEGGSKTQTYDLTPQDPFWAKNAAAPFPTVAEDVTSEWARYQADADSITKQTGSSSLDDFESSQFASQLKGAMARLPELKARKANIEMHMTILENLMNGIKQRKLDEFFQTEEDLEKLSSAQILAIIKDSDKGNEPLDKLRLFLQWYLLTEQEISRADLDSFTQALETAGADTTAVKYVKTVRQITRMTMIASAPTQQATQNTSHLFGGFSGLGSRLKDAGLGANLGAIEGVLSGIKSYLPTNSDLTLTKITESLMDPTNASASAISKTEKYLFFDPRSANARGTLPPATQSRTHQSTVGRGIDATFGQRRQGFTEAIVFPVGGASMDEYNNLMEWAKRTSAAGTGQKRRVVYGSTMIYSAKDFITTELEPLGKEST